MYRDLGFLATCNPYLGNIAKTYGLAIPPFEYQILELRWVVTTFESQRILAPADIDESARYI